MHILGISPTITRWWPSSIGAEMSVRFGLLAILDQGPCYGYQLRAEFERRTGAAWPLNVGQIYRTLERLERDGWVAKGDTDAHGHVFYAITDAGSAAVASWLGAPVERGPGSRDEVAVKVAMATTLPGVDASEVIAAQRAETSERLEALRAGRRSGSPEGEDPADPLAFADSLIADSQVFATEAELRWLDHAAERLAQHPEHALSIALATALPARGRPRTAPTGKVPSSPVL